MTIITLFIILRITTPHVHGFLKIVSLAGLSGLLVYCQYFQIISLAGEIVAIIPNVTMEFPWAHKVDFLLIVEKVA